MRCNKCNKHNCSCNSNGNGYLIKLVADLQKRVEELETIDQAGFIRTINNKPANSNGNFNEDDPTVPAWAKLPNKPIYTLTDIQGVPELLATKADKTEVANKVDKVTNKDLIENYLIDKIRKDFIQVDTIQELRNLSSFEINLLKTGVVKGVTVHGYYIKDDTPAPIQYFLSTTSAVDDGGSVIAVGDIKLEHDFGGLIHMSYFGAIGDFTGSTSNTYTDNYIFIQNAINKILKGKLLFKKGAYAFSQRLEIPTADGGANSIEIVFDTDGRISSGGNLSQSSSGIVQLNYVGTQQSQAIVSDSVNTWVDFKHIGLVNNSGRSDVDGLVMNNYRSNRMTNTSIILFRDNLRINGDSYYTVFDQCYFTHGKRYNVYMDGLANLVTFNECRISLSEQVGLRAPTIGDGINIVNSFIEGNKGAGVHVGNCRLINISGTYIENNATIGEVVAGVKAQIIINSYGNNNNIPTKLVLNQNYIMGAGDGCEVVYASHTDSPLIGNLCISIIENTIPATLITKDITTTDRTHLVRCNYPSRLELKLENNKYAYTDKTKMYYPVNSRPSILASFQSRNDDSVNFLRPEWNNAIFGKTTDKGLSYNKVSYINPAVLGDGSNKDTTFQVDYDFPDLSTVGADIRKGRFTNSTGNITETWYNTTPGLSDISAQLNLRTGQFRAKEIAVGTDGDTKILTGIAVPEGNFFAKKGSIYLYGNTGSANKGIYIKTTDVTLNTGWELLVPMRQSAYSPDTATVASGANPTKAEFDALLAEFRDFKNKSRTSGQSSST